MEGGAPKKVLPPPPTDGDSLWSISSNTAARTPLPPPPTFDPLSIPSVSTTTTRRAAALQRVPLPPPVHRTTQDIPELRSAPNSGPGDPLTHHWSPHEDHNHNNNNNNNNTAPNAMAVGWSSSSALSVAAAAGAAPTPHQTVPPPDVMVSPPQIASGTQIRRRSVSRPKSTSSSSSPTTAAAASSSLSFRASSNTRSGSRTRGSMHSLASIRSAASQSVRSSSRTKSRGGPSSLVATGSSASASASRSNSRGAEARSRLLRQVMWRACATRQTHICVLVVPTSKCQELVMKKNHLSISQLLNAMGNSIAPPPHQQASSMDRGGITPMRLPPFRSIGGKSMMLTWDQLQLRFVDADDFFQPNEHLMDLELGSAARSCNDSHDTVDRLDESVQELLRKETQQQQQQESQHHHDPIGVQEGGDEHEGFSEETEGGGLAAKAKQARDEALSWTTTSPGSSSGGGGSSSSLMAAHAHNSQWLVRFREALDTCTDHLSHEMISCPPVCLVVASSDELGGNNPVDCLAELASSHHHLPAPFRNGHFDPNGMRREFLLLHDEVDGPPDFDENVVLREMQARFGVGCCAVLRINSISTPDSASSSPDPILEKYSKDSPINNNNNNNNNSDDQSVSSTASASAYLVRGACLSLTDKMVLRRYVAAMITNGLLPAIERRISNLNNTVSNAKKGMKNLVKSFWRKPGSSSSTANNSTHGANNSSGNASLHDSRSNALVDAVGGLVPANDPEIRYRYDSIESQVRLLADTLFLMRDYEASLGIYKLCKDDYKHDRSLVHYASIHEMIGLCLYMLDPFGNRYARDIFGNMETALYSYTRAAEEERGPAKSGRPTVAPLATRLATRLCLVFSGSRNMGGDRHMEMADLLASASSHETALGAAVLLEQSASHYFQAQVYRKYAFHMLMSGHMFRAAQQEYHAFRCFTASLHLYHGGKWDELENHLRSALAAQLFTMERMATAMQMYCKLVGTTGGGRVSQKSQQKFVHHLLELSRGRLEDALLCSDRMMCNDEHVPEDAASRSRALGRIVRHSPGAKRMLEIPNMHLPHIHDSTLVVTQDASTPITTNTASGSSLNESSTTTTSTLGVLSPGSERVWQDLICTSQAELRAAASAATAAKGQDGGVRQTDFIAKVIEEIDNEKAHAAMLARAKKSSNYKEMPAVRARMEPLDVTFSMENPLSIDLPVQEMQLVVRLKSSANDRVCTSEDAIDTDTTSLLQAKDETWNFSGSTEVFRRADFCRISPQSGSEAWEFSGTAPYFVVTKSSFTLPPSTRSNQTLRVCPMVTGDLEILGVRCKLFDELWVYHPFQIKGPLLQNTRVNRANRVRGEPLLLKSKIENNMPSLSVDLVPSEKDDHSSIKTESGTNAVLQGQTSLWTLRVKNVGTAPACRVTLKTNTPWINIMQGGNQAGSGSLDDWEYQATSHCIGPTGTMMKLPIQIKGEEQGVLQPGKSQEIPIMVRTSGGGQQDFYMLFRYELWDGGVAPSSSTALSSSTMPKYRWLRKMISVPVFPSLTLTASLMPSYWKKREHILSIEVTNYRSDQQSKLDICLDKMCVASSSYRIQKLAGQLGESEPLSSEAHKQELHGGPVSALEIGWQERVTMHYLIIPLENGTTGSDYTLSECQFMGEMKVLPNASSVDKSNGTCITDFVCLEHAHETFTNALRAHEEEEARREREEEQKGRHPRSIHQIRRDKSSVNDEGGDGAGSEQGKVSEDGTINSMGEKTESKRTPLHHPTSVASLCPHMKNCSINVICSWIAAGGDGITNQMIKGQHHLKQLAVRPQKKAKGCPLTVTARHKSDIAHDFSTGPVKTDFDVTVRNRLVESPVEFEFTVERQDGLEFIGAESFVWTLEGGEELTIPLVAMISSSGIYNLQSVRLTVISSSPTSDDETSSETRVPYLFPLQWILKINGPL